MLAQTTTEPNGAAGAIVLFIILGLAVLVIWGTYRIAVNNGRDGGIAILLAIFFGLFALAGYAIAGPKKDRTVTDQPVRR